jgi:hypothetical protein
MSPAGCFTKQISGPKNSALASALLSVINGLNAIRGNSTAEPSFD